MTGKQQTPLEKTKEGINLGRLSDKILQDVIERPLRRAARQTRDKVVGRLMEPGAERMFKKPALFPGDWLLIPFGVILCIGVIVASIGLFGLPKKAPVVQSGPMPMGEKFEVAPNKETNPDMLPIFDGGLSETKKVFECRDVVSMFITTPGTLVIDNFTKKNIRVETPASFPGLITLECNGKIGLSQTQLLAAPTIPAPTQFATNTTAPTQIPPQTTETQPAPVSEVSTVVPATSEMNYATWVIYDNAPQSISWNFIPVESLAKYTYALSGQPCGVPIAFPVGYPRLQALIKINSSTYYADVVVTNNTVMVMCTGTFDLVSLQ